jgi:hypothetical protein
MRGRALALAALTGLMGACKFELPLSARSPIIAGIEATKPDRVTLGMARLAFDDFGVLDNHTLTTHAMPYKVVVTALVLQQSAREGKPPGPVDAKALFQRYGWITPTAIENWTGPQPSLDKPLGLVSGEFRNAIARIRLEVANVGCATCHAAMTYDAGGNPTGRAWLGAANTSRNFDTYLGDIVAALRFAAGRPDEFLAAVPRVFPDVHPDEVRTIRRVVFPEIRKRLAEADSRGENLLPFSNGGAGLTNGVAALKRHLDPTGGLLSGAEHGYVSVPDLEGRTLRSSFLADGVYAPDAARRFEARTRAPLAESDRRRMASIVAFFLVPTAGIKPTVSERQARRVADVLAFLEEYRPPRFPGRIDVERALRGAGTFERWCERCHGRYEEDARGMRVVRFPNRHSTQGEMGTDPERWRVVSREGVQAIARLKVGPRLNAARTEGYVAPILSGIWMTAPYLHNGSVPTLWHLMRAPQRPAKFMAGGHRLDFVKVGIAGVMAGDGVYRYPDGHVPWATPDLHDTAAPGKSNAGHEREFAELTEAEKDDLLEYLKRL